MCVCALYVGARAWSIVYGLHTGYLILWLFFIFISRYNRTKIRWSKNSLFLTKTKTIKISKKGALRVLDVTYRDAGIYACHAGLSAAELKLTVKPKPGDPPPTAEDYEDSAEYGENQNQIVHIS